MKKLLTFLFALMLVSTFTFGTGDAFFWKGPVGGSWTVAANWTKLPLSTLGAGYTEPSGASTWPGQSQTGDVAIVNNGFVGTITSVPNITLGGMDITYDPILLATSLVTLVGLSDGVTITMSTPSSQRMTEFDWALKVDEGCFLSFWGGTSGNRIKLDCLPGANVWQKNGSTFNPVNYGGSVCDLVNQGFILRAAFGVGAAPGIHAEFIQQQSVTQVVKGWIEMALDNNKYHLICPPITSSPQVGEYTNVYCRTHNCLCVFDMDYLRKFSNLASGCTGNWEPWLGNVGSCFNPVVDMETGRGYDYYGNPGNTITPSGIYQIYGDFNTAAGGAITLPIGCLGWNLVGNPYPSAVTFGEPSGSPSVGTGWTWNINYTNPIAYWWDNAIPGYRFWNWYTGTGNGNVPDPAPYVYKRTVPRSQGFFVDAIGFDPNGNITISNEARVFRSARPIMKATVNVNYLNIALNNSSGKYIDDAIVNFREDVNGTEFNRLTDARKMYNDLTGVSQLYFKTTDNVDLAMKTLKLESGNIMYPLYLKVETSGTYSLSVQEITFPANTGVMLKDNKTNTMVDLKANPVYTFTATEGDNDARFSLYFSNVLYGIDNLSSSTFKVYSFDNNIFVQNNDLKSATGTIFVYDMIGKQMMQQNLSGDAITRINTNLNKGFYIVSIKTADGAYNQKVYIN